MRRHMPWVLGVLFSLLACTKGGLTPLTPPPDKQTVIDPIPFVILSVNASKGPIYVASGSNVVVQWSSINSIACQLLVNGTRTGEGTSQSLPFDNITVKTVFKVECVSSSGRRASDEAAVEMLTAGQSATPSVQITANFSRPTLNLNAPQKVVLRWITSATPTSCEIRDGAGAVLSRANSELAGYETGVISSSSLFFIACLYPGNVIVSDSVQVILQALPAPTIPPLVILTADHLRGTISIANSSSVALRWATSVLPLSCSVKRGPTEISTAIFNLAGLDSGALLSQTVFSLSCTFPGGIVVTDSLTVNPTLTPLSAERLRCPTGTHLLFTTSTGRQGNFGGIVNAQAACNSAATAAGLKGKYKVLLGQVGQPDPRDAVTILGSICNGKGEIIAADGTEFWSGTLKFPLDYDEFGTKIAGNAGNGNVSVWTNFNKSGVHFADPDSVCQVCDDAGSANCLAQEQVCKRSGYDNGSCNNWTSTADSGDAGINGTANRTNNKAFWYTLTSQCGNTNRFYCLEQR